MYFLIVIICSFTIFTSYYDAAAFQIDPNDSCDAVEGRRSCACVLESRNESISLWNITLDWNHIGKPRFQANDSINWFYSFNPCLDFSLFENQTEKYPGYRPCHDVAAARWTTESVHRCDNLGSQSQGKFNVQPMDVTPYRTANLTLEFRDSSPENGAVISLICNQTLTIKDSRFKYLGVINKPLPIYYFELESLCCCPGACQLPPPKYPDKTSSLWWIFAVVVGILIIIAVIAAVVLETRKRQQKTGAAKPLLSPNPNA